MKARVLTENEYVEMMKEKDRQEKEAGELKKKRKEEWEEKKRERERQKKEREKERQRKKKEREEEEKKKKEKETEEKRKQGRPKKGKQPVQAAMESSGSSSKSECEVRSWLQTVRQFPARFWADSRSESETSDSGILCVLCSAREPQTWMLRSGWTVETVVTGFIPPVHLVTIAAHASMFVWTACSV